MAAGESEEFNSQIFDDLSPFSNYDIEKSICSESWQDIEPEKIENHSKPKRFTSRQSKDLDRDRKRFLRANESKEQKMLRNSARAAWLREKRARETPEEGARRRALGAAQRRAARQRENPEKTVKRRRSQAARLRALRDAESPESKARRRAMDAAKKRALRSAKKGEIEPTELVSCVINDDEAFLEPIEFIACAVIKEEDNL